MRNKKLRDILLYVAAGAITFLLASGLLACRTVHRTINTSSDTLVRIRPVSARFDTTLHLRGDSLHLVALVPLVNGVPQLEEQTVREGGITATVSISDGQLKLKAVTKDTAISVAGLTTVNVADTTIHERQVITITKEPSLLRRISQGLKESVIILVIAAVALLIIFYPFLRKCLI